MSIVAFYMRLNGFTSRAWMIAHSLFMGFLASCAVISVLITVCQCKPPFSWNLRAAARYGKPFKCFEIGDVVAGLNAWHVFSDLCLLIVPFTMLWTSQMKRTKKLKVWIAGIVGVVNCGLAAGRTASQYTQKTSDPTCECLPCKESAFLIWIVQIIGPILRNGSSPSSQLAF